MLFTIFMFFDGCSTSEKSINSKKTDSTYVFDSMPPDTSFQVEQAKTAVPELPVKYYLVQIGAFTTKNRAETFAMECKRLIKEKINIAYSDNVKLYVVQLTPFYTSRKEAEKIRNDLWKMSEFKDAWIVTVNR